MAGQSTIGALRVVLGADTAALDKGLKDSQAGLAAFGTAVAGSLAVVAAAAVAAGTAIGVAMKHTIDDMDKLSKSSQKIGVPIEQLSALQYAASLADVSFESLSKAVGKLSKNMVEAAAKPTSEAANAFRALGVSVKDSEGKLKSSQDVMADVADKFSGLKDGAGKTAVSMAIFGKAGADLIPLLNDGREGLKEMSDEASKFGLIIDSKTGKAAEAFNDNLTRLKAAWQGIIAQATAQVLPSMVAITDAMVATAKSSGILEVGLTAVGNGMKALVTGGVILGSVFRVLAEYISTVSGALSLILKGEFNAALEKIKGGVSSITETATHSFGVIDTLWNGAKKGADGAAESTEKASKVQKDFNFSALGGKNAVDQFIASQNKSLESQRAEIQTFGELAGNKEALKIQLQALSLATANHTTITAAQQAQLDLTKNRALEYGQALAGLQLTQANLTPAQLYQQELTKIQALFDNGKISAETYGEALNNAAERASSSWETAGAKMAGGFADLANAFSKNNKEMAIAGKAFGIVQATINTYVAFTKALSSAAPPFNYVLAAGVLAAGIAQVAKISSQSTSGMMTGGAMTVRGTGGPDSVPVQFMASPGEQIDVWRPEQGGGQDPRKGAGGGNTVNLSMPIATTRDALRSLIEGLNDMFSDGYRLNVVPA